MSSERVTSCRLLRLPSPLVNDLLALFPNTPKIDFSGSSPRSEPFRGTAARRHVAAGSCSRASLVETKPVSEVHCPNCACPFPPTHPNSPPGVSSLGWPHRCCLPVAEPERWGEHYPACSGNKQSPINIETEKTIFSPELQPIQLSGYSLPNSKKFKLKNNGHTGGCERHRVPLLAGPGFPETLPVALGELCSGAFQPGGEKPGDGELTTRCLWVVAPGICYNPCFL